MSNTNEGAGGASFLGLLGLLFIGLKLGGAIDWSWWLVLLPLYGGFLIVLAILLIVALGMGGSAFFNGWKRGKREARAERDDRRRQAKAWWLDPRAIEVRSNGRDAR